MKDLTNEYLDAVLHAAEQNMTDVLTLWQNGRTSDLVFGEALRDMKHDGLKRVKALRQAIATTPPAAPEAAEAWVSVQERLPEAAELYWSKRVLAFWDGGTISVQSYYNADPVRGRAYRGWFLDEQTYEDGSPQVTHWMPLPAPPQQKGGPNV